MDSNYNYEEELMIKIAWYYYIENLTQQEIAKILTASKSCVCLTRQRKMD